MKQKSKYLISVLFQHFVNSSQISGGGGLGSEGGLRLLFGVESLLLDLTLSLQSLNQRSVVPAILLGQVAKYCEVAVGSHADGLKSLGDDQSLHLVVGSGDALEGLMQLNKRYTLAHQPTTSILIRY